LRYWHIAKGGLRYRGIGLTPIELELVLNNEEMCKVIESEIPDFMNKLEIE
jgi:hypothetical protein